MEKENKNIDNTSDLKNETSKIEEVKTSEDNNIKTDEVLNSEIEVFKEEIKTLKEEVINLKSVITNKNKVINSYKDKEVITISNLKETDNWFSNK